MKIRTLLLFSIFIVFSNIIFSQQKIIRGLISSDDGVQKSFVAVEIYDTAFNQLAYIPLEEKNHFEAIVDSSLKSVNLIITTIGCNTYTQKIDFNGQNMFFANIRLENCIQELKEVIVSAERSFIKERGDTLSFDVAGFKTDTDLNLGDILNKLPGIEISSGNQILYQGKRVKQIWVQGRDILNNQHSLALDGLKAEDIDNIQVIHEYKPFHKRFSQEHTDEVALNINLKKSALGKINGELKFLTGIENKYQAKSEAIQVKTKGGSAAFVRSNNLGAQLITPLEYLGLITDISKLEQQHSGEISVLPEPVLPDTDVNIAKQHLLVSSSDFDINKKTKSRISLLGFYKKTKSETGINSFFFDTGTSFEGEESKTNRFPLLSGNCNLKRKQSDKLLLEFDLPVLFMHANTNQKRTGSHAQNPFLSFFAKKEKTLEILPKISINMRHKREWTSTHNIIVELKNTESGPRLSENKNEEPFLNQELIKKNRSLTFLSSFEKKRNRFLLKIWNQTTFKNFDIKLPSDNLPNYKNQTNYAARQYNWHPGIQYGIKNKKWMTHLQLQLANEYASVNNQSFNLTRLNPVFRLKYNWRLSKFIGSTIGKNQNLLAPQNTFDLYELKDNLQIIRYSLEPGIRTESKYIDLYYFNIRKEKNSSINCVINYKSVKNALSRINRFENNFIISELFLAQKENTGSFNLSFSHPFFSKKYKWKAKLNSTLSDMERAPYNTIKQQQLNMSFYLFTNRSDKWNVKAGARYQTSRQKFELQNHFRNTWSTELETRCKLQKWNFIINYNWQINSFENTSLVLHLLDFSIDLKLSNKWSLNLLGQDILNLGKSESIELRSTPTLVEETLFTRLRGSFLIGANYAFSKNK